MKLYMKFYLNPPEQKLHRSILCLGYAHFVNSSTVTSMYFTHGLVEGLSLSIFQSTYFLFLSS